MLKFFFHGYGYWFYQHRGRRIYHINPIESAGVSAQRSVLTPTKDNEIICNTPVETIGYFHLEREFEYSFKKTGSTRFIKKLFPSPDGEAHTTFPKITENVMIGFKSVLAEDCFFLIDTDKEYDLTIEKNVNDSDQQDIVLKDNPIQQKSNSHDKYTRLEEFIEWLKTQANCYGVSDFDEFKLDCTKEELFTALKYWEKERYKKIDLVWKNINGLNSFNNFWKTSKRKGLIDVADNRRGRRNSGYPHIFKKIKMDIFL